MHCLTGNQWSWRRAVVDGSDELLSTILATVLSTRWTLRRLETEVPNKIELEKSRWEETRLMAIDLAISSESTEQMWRKACRWKKADLHTDEMCRSSERWLSRVTPRVSTVLDVVMMEPAMLTEETGVEDAERCLAENQMASDLSGLSVSPLTQNQWWSWIRNCSTSCTVVVGAAGGMEMNNWVSSAYCWCEMTNRRGI